MIDHVFAAVQLTGEEFDMLLAAGWRHTSGYFFRMNITELNGEIAEVVPLRIRLSDFRLSKSQKRILSKNIDTACIIRPTVFTHEKAALFEKHKQRFNSGAPESLSVYLSEAPDKFPVTNYEFEVRVEGKLIAASFLDIGNNSTSAVYAMFNPEESKRGLGIYTMLKEIEFSISEGKEFYYPGYAYKQSSYYDYKKNFYGLESYNWESGRWENYPKMGR